MSPALPLGFWLCERGWKQGKRHACRVRGSVAPVKFDRDLQRSEPNPVLFVRVKLKAGTVATVTGAYSGLALPNTV